MEKNEEKQKLGFIGLGALGSRLAAHLLADGHSLTVWNRSPEKCQPLVAAGALAAEQASAAVPAGGIVFSILWDDASVEELVASQGFLDKLRGGIHVSLTTITPATAKKLAALHAANASTYVEAPIFGVPQAVEARQALFCLAGPSAAKARVRPLLESLGKQVYDFGEVGGGTATKLVGNFLIITGFAALQESWGALTRAGLDPKPTLDMLTSTLAATPGNQRYAGYLLSKTPPPASGIPDKDLGLFAAFAGSAPLAQSAREVLAAATAASKSK